MILAITTFLSSLFEQRSFSCLLLKLCIDLTAAKAASKSSQQGNIGTRAEQGEKEMVQGLESNIISATVGST